MSAANGQGGDPDAMFKWDFFLRRGHDEIWIMRSYLGLEVRHNGCVTKGEFLQWVGSEVGRLPKSDPMPDLEGYILLTNPVARHREHAQIAEQSLRAIELEPVLRPSQPVATKDAIAQYMSTLLQRRESLKWQNYHAAALVTSAAFYAEATLNLLIALLVRKERRMREADYDAFLHCNWRKKLESLPAWCDHVTGTPNLESAGATKATALFNLRNRIAHSYPSKEDWAGEQIWFYDRIPLFPRAEPTDSYQLAAWSRVPRIDEALLSLERAEAFVGYLESLLHPDIRPQFRDICDTNPLGQSLKTGRYGKPFADTLNLAHLVLEHGST